MAKTKSASKGNTDEGIAEQSVGDAEVEVCRRTAGERRNDETAEGEIEVLAADDADSDDSVDVAPKERRKVQRRRQIDPTTCERDYTNDEIEFMHALDAYKRANGRMFPTCSEILEVVRSLGYERLELLEEDAASDEASNATESNREPAIAVSDAVPADGGLPIAENSEESEFPGAEMNPFPV